MIRVLLILIGIAVSIEANYKDLNPSKIVKIDIDILKKFDKKLYKIAESKRDKRKVNPSKIYKFIVKNKAMINDYSRIKAYSKAEVGSRTRRGIGGLEEGYSLEDEVTNSREYYVLAIGLTYPIYDKKTEKLIKNERILQNNKILNKVFNYTEVIEEIEILEEDLEIERLKQIRDKALVKTGMKYLDERIKTIEKIHKIRVDIRRKKHKKERLKEELKLQTTKPNTLEKYYL